MQVREELEKAIHGPVKGPDDAERISRAAELLGEYLVLEERARRLLGGLTRDDRPGGDLRGLSLHDAAERVLEEAGVPLHVKELGARIRAGGWRHPRSSNAHPQRIFFQLAARLPRHPDRFRRVAPNTFALVRWEREGPSEHKQRPRTGLFSGSGGDTARAIAESDEHITGEQARWRSS